MKAVVSDRPGPADLLKVAEIETPAVPDDGVLVRVHASSINPVDLFSLTPVQHFMRRLAARGKAQAEVLGNDFAGTVMAVGSAVTQFRAGDEVFGAHKGAFAQYLAVPESAGVVCKPTGADFAAAAAVPVAALTALQAVRDHGCIQPGQRVLVNGSSGGVGHFALQIAKALGGEVTAVCSTAKVEDARALGADHVIDYTRADFAEGAQSYDLVIDVAGSRPWSRCVRVMEPRATLVLAGASALKASAWRMIGHLAATRIAAVRGSRRAVFFIASIRRNDLHVLADMLADGRIRPIIDAHYPLRDIGGAFRHLSDGHARGKIVIDVEEAR